MAASNEWTEYHLTPAGWELGTEKTDFDLRTREPPGNRVLTVRWIDYLGHHYGRPQRSHEEVWRSKDELAISVLTAKFGDPPSHL